MIFGIIPIGGKGTRLGLPYSKEMLPQKNYDIFNPVVNHLVEKMLLAGAEYITFVHGTEYKLDVFEFFQGKKFTHILQNKTGFANVILDFYNQMNPCSQDKILFGLPDSVFNGNPFVEMLNKKGTVAGCFTTEPYAKVDRLSLDNSKFLIKTEKTPDNQNRFWGVIKFDYDDICKMVQDNVFESYTEIGQILNLYKFSIVEGDKYLDLGTWEGYNRYLTSIDIGTNNEIEKKYDASLVSKEDFYNYFVDNVPKKITSTDHYFIIDNPNVEFVRYREDSIDEGSIPDITIKNYNESQFNRFELMVPLSKNASKNNVIHLLSLMGAKFQFDVTKDCIIVELENCTIVFYEFCIKEKSRKIIEIELKKADFNLIKTLENTLISLPGFSPSKTIKESKFQMVREIYDSSH